MIFLQSVEWSFEEYLDYYLGHAKDNPGKTFSFYGLSLKTKDPISVSVKYDSKQKRYSVKLNSIEYQKYAIPKTEIFIYNNQEVINYLREHLSKDHIEKSFNELNNNINKIHNTHKNNKALYFALAVSIFSIAASIATYNGIFIIGGLILAGVLYNSFRD